MTAYVDYTYYSATFLGTAIASTDFSRLALRATEQVDLLTFDRALPVITAATDTATITRIKNATCAVAEEIQRQEQNSADGIASESVGSYSVSFAPTSSKMLTNQNKITSAASTYLSSTGLMYKGFYSDEYGCTIDDEC